MIERVAGRGVVMAPSGRVVMIRGQDPNEPELGSFWFTPGGGLEPGESLDAGTKRELWEELGLRVSQLGPVVMTQINAFPMAGKQYRQTETIFLVEVDDEFEIAPVLLEDIELSVIDEFRWLSADEMRSNGELVYPAVLPDLVDEIRTNGPPARPWTDDLT